MRFLYAVNVVIPIIFFCSIHNDTSVVSIPKTVIIDANYLLKLETFLIHFDEGKGTCTRSSKGSQLRGEKSGIYQNDFFGFLSRHQTKSKQIESA